MAQLRSLEQRPTRLKQFARKQISLLLMFAMVQMLSSNVLAAAHMFSTAHDVFEPVHLHIAMDNGSAVSHMEDVTSEYDEHGAENGVHIHLPVCALPNDVALKPAHFSHVNVRSNNVVYISLLFSPPVPPPNS